MAGGKSSKDLARKTKKNHEVSSATASPASLSVKKQLDALKEGREKGLSSDWQVVYNNARDLLIWICPNTGNSYDRLSEALHAASEWKKGELRRSKTMAKNGSSPSSTASNKSSAPMSPGIDIHKYRGRKLSLPAAESSPIRKPSGNKTFVSPQSQKIQGHRSKPKPKSSPNKNIASSSSAPQEFIVLSSDSEDESSSPPSTQTTEKRSRSNDTTKKASPSKSPNDGRLKRKHGDGDASSPEPKKSKTMAQSLQSKIAAAAANAAEAVMNINWSGNLEPATTRVNDNKNEQHNRSKLQKSVSDVIQKSKSIIDAVNLAKTARQRKNSADSRGLTTPPGTPTKRGRGRPLDNSLRDLFAEKMEVSLNHSLDEKKLGESAKPKSQEDAISKGSSSSTGSGSLKRGRGRPLDNSVMTGTQHETFEVPNRPNGRPQEVFEIKEKETIESREYSLEHVGNIDLSNEERDKQLQNPLDNNPIRDLKKPEVASTNGTQLKMGNFATDDRVPEISSNVQDTRRQSSDSDSSTKPKAVAALNVVKRGPGRPRKNSVESAEGKNNEVANTEKAHCDAPVAAKRKRGRPPKNAVATSIDESTRPLIIPKRPRGRPRKDPAQRGRGRPKKSQMALAGNDTSTLNREGNHEEEKKEDGVEKKQGETSEDKENGNGDIKSANIKKGDLDEDDSAIKPISYVYPPWLPQPDPRAKVEFLRAHREDKSDPIVPPPMAANSETSSGEEQPSGIEASGKDNETIEVFAASNEIASHTLFEKTAPRKKKCKQPVSNPETIAIDANSMEALIRKPITMNQTDEPKGDSPSRNIKKKSMPGTPIVTTFESDMDCTPNTQRKIDDKDPTPAAQPNYDYTPTELFPDDGTQRVTRGMRSKSRECQQYIWDKYVQKMIKSVEDSGDNGYWV